MSLNQVKSTLCRTQWYVPPEVLREMPYTKPVDIYSFGIIMWEPWNKKRYQNVIVHLLCDVSLILLRMVTFAQAMDNVLVKKIQYGQ